MNRFSDKVVVVTGAASGIGEAAARLFAAEGGKVVVADVNAARGEQVAADIGGFFMHTDVTREEAIEALVAATLEHHGRIDCMINNAGMVGAVGSILETPGNYWRATQSVLLDSVFYGIKHAGRAMREQKSGVILSVSSIAGVMGGLGPHAYTAAKHAVVGLTRSAASELSRHGIRVNAIAPGTTVTALIEEVRGGREQALAAAAQVSPLGSALLPEEIAAGLLFLAGDAAAHITGHTLVVDSGVTGAGAASGASVLKGQSMRFVGASHAAD
ncbi:short-chain dehydrogenase [Pseudomonas sp. G11-1]|nr:short-chain dehydrogenase [Pseudomonas sp. G11-1]MCO5789866.1 short-chain dehydrogenase [Pseudomonas sp. G11-2]